MWKKCLPLFLSLFLYVYPTALRAYSLWNQLKSNVYMMKDPLLSQAGEAAAAAISTSPAFCVDGVYQPPELVVVSPLRRTMQTAALAFDTSRLRCAVRPELQENGLTPCDCATPELGVEQEKMTLLFSEKEGELQQVQPRGRVHGGPLTHDAGGTGRCGRLES